MASNKILGLILANTNEKNMPDLTAHRTMGSVPFCGKYRLIDFPLSNMSNSGINNVGIVAKSNFQSLMDHLGSGSAWDLARRHSGLSILPPYGEHHFSTIVEAVFNLHGYIEHGNEEYVLISTTDCIYNMDFSKVLSFHEKNNADITFIYTKAPFKQASAEYRCALEMDESGHVSKIMASAVNHDICNLSTGTVLIKKHLLMTLIRQAVAESKYNFLRHILQPMTDRFRVFGYEKKGYCEFIDSVKDYFYANMKLMNADTRAELFNPRRPIYTKVRDDMPSRYGLDSHVKGSLIAQGCVINGVVENSIISKGVYIGYNTKISNCIIMQDSVIGDDADLNYIVIDKDVKVSAKRSVQGCTNFPMYISKRAIV